MARVTHVQRAQQRFKMVPVLGTDGEPIQTPVMRPDGTQKTTKTGRLVFMSRTIADRSQPLPEHTCEVCRKTIEVGAPYKHVTPKSGPFGGSTRYRCDDCPTWQIWDLSSSLSARVAQIQAGFDVSGAESVDDVTDALTSMAAEVRDLAAEKQEGADNIEAGFGHETSQSMELAEQADALESWADEIEEADVPDFPEPEEGDCEDCGGDGKIEIQVESSDVPNEEDCEQCGGTGQFTPEEPTEEQIADWLAEVEDAVSITDESPV